MRVLPLITDPVYLKPAKRSSVDKFFISLLRDERDLPFVHLSLQITFSLIPLAVILYLPFVGGWYWALAAIGYQYLNNFVFKGSFGLMLHCTSHRILFKKKYKLLNYYIPWILAPFFGHSPETYFVHHIGMHHPENNLEGDESTTMPFQRDSFGDFMKYFGSFLFLSFINLPKYFYRRHRNTLLYRYVRGELVFFLFCIALCFVNWPATLVVFIIPLFIFRLIAMMGNWAQHAFVCAQDPSNAYKNSITVINTKYNHKCWNDGYHISHHIKPAMHWTEHPLYFQSTLKEYAENDAIIFDGIHFLHVFVWLMGKRYDLLADHFVNVGQRFKSDEEIIAFLKMRTQKIAGAAYVIA
ncbi:MAG: fatty acid desaturase [Bacteroidota bacterium]